MARHVGYWAMAVFNEDDYEFADIVGTEQDNADTVISGGFGVLYWGAGSSLSEFGTVISTGYMNSVGEIWETFNTFISIEYFQIGTTLIRLHSGTHADETFVGGQDNISALHGSLGTDVLTYTGTFADYGLSMGHFGYFNEILSITAADGVTTAGEVSGFEDRIYGGIEQIAFADATFSLRPSTGNDLLFGVAYYGPFRTDNVVNFDGGAGDDYIVLSSTGGAGNNGSLGQDKATGGEGDDLIEGAWDEIIFSGNVADYSFYLNSDGNYNVVDNVGTDGTDTIVNIRSHTEFVFADQSLTEDEIAWAVPITTFTLADAVGGDGGEFLGTITGTAGEDVLLTTGASISYEHLFVRITNNLEIVLDLLDTSFTRIGYYDVENIEVIDERRYEGGTSGDDYFLTDPILNTSLYAGLGKQYYINALDGVDVLDFGSTTTQDLIDGALGRVERRSSASNDLTLRNLEVIVNPDGSTSNQFIVSQRFSNFEIIRFDGVDYNYSRFASEDSDFIVSRPDRTLFLGGGDDIVISNDDPSNPTIAYGEAGNDILFATQVTGGAGDDILTVTQTFSVVDRFAMGGEGDDIISSPREIRYDGNVANYSFYEDENGTRTIVDNVGNEGTDTIVDIVSTTRFVFADQTLADSDITWSVPIATFTLADAVGANPSNGYEGVITGTSGVDELLVTGAFAPFDFYEVVGVSDGTFQLNLYWTFLISSGPQLVEYYDVDGIEIVGSLSLIDGTANDDVFIADRNDASFVSYGSGPDLYISGGDGFDSVNYGSGASFGDFTFARESANQISVTNNSAGYTDQLFFIEQIEIGGQVYGFSPSSGNDILIGLTGADTFYAGDGDDLVVAEDTPGSPTIAFGEGGNDTLFGTQVTGGAGDDILTVTQTFSVVDRFAMGGEGDDIISSPREIRYLGNVDDYSLVDNGDGTRTITDNVGNEGTDTILNIGSLTRFVFADATLDSNDPRWTGDVTYLGTPGNDVLLGNDGDNVISGFAGDDELTGGAGSDTISGGAGNDIIYADSEDVFTNLTGGSGTDRLELTRSEAQLVGYDYQTLDFLGQGFERAFVFNTAGQEVGRYTLSSFGQSFLVSDVNDTEEWYRKVLSLERPGEDNYSWVSRETTIYDGTRGTETFTIFDNGRENLVKDRDDGYDYSSTTYDVTDLAVWTTVKTYYDYGPYINDYQRSSIRKRFVVEFDESYTSDEIFVTSGDDRGASTKTLTDTAGNQSWEVWTFEYNAARQTVTSDRLNDSGIRNFITYDRDGEFDWATRSVTTDETAGLNYTSTTREVNAAGQTLLLSINYDVGFTRTTEYDVANEFVWSKTLTLIDEDDTENWASKVEYYDEADAVYLTMWYGETGDNTISFSGDSSADRLVSTLESFEYLDYAAGGFETGRVFNAAGDLLGLYYISSQGYGVYQNNDIDEVGVLRTVRHIDLSGSESWSQRDFTFNFNNQLDVLVTAFDDGRVVTIDYDQSSVLEYLRLESTVDGADVFAWDQKDVYIGDDGNAYQTFYYVNALDAESVIGLSDNDRLIVQSESFMEIDYAAQGFETGRIINSAGDVLGLYYVNGSGLGVVNQYDIAGTETWARKTTLIDIDATQSWSTRDYFYDDNDALTELVTYYDGGRQYTVTYDVGDTEDWSVETLNEDIADQFSWTSIFQRTDDSGELSYRLIDNDSGFTEITEWDLDGTEAWARLVTWVDVDNTEAWTIAEFYYNDDGDLYGTIYS